MASSWPRRRICTACKAPCPMKGAGLPGWGGPPLPCKNASCRAKGERAPQMPSRLASARQTKIVLCKQRQKRYNKRENTLRGDEVAIWRAAWGSISIFHFAAANATTAIFTLWPAVKDGWTLIRRRCLPISRNRTGGEGLLGGQYLFWGRNAQLLRGEAPARAAGHPQAPLPRGQSGRNYPGGHPGQRGPDLPAPAAQGGIQPAFSGHAVGR